MPRIGKGGKDERPHRSIRAAGRHLGLICGLFPSPNRRGGITVLPGHFSSLMERTRRATSPPSLDDLKKRNDGLVVLQRESEEGFVRYLLESLPKFIRGHYL
jgi:hypothetical protein